jgi:hemolysin activation/secretion protein
LKTTKLPTPWLIALLTSVNFLSGIAQAQSLGDLPDPSIELRRQQEEEARRRVQAAPAPASAPKDLRAPAETLLLADEAPCFHINEVRLQGNDEGHFDWTLSSLDGPNGNDSPMGRCLGVKSIEILQKRLQNAVIARGFVTSRVLVSNQNLADGILVFEPVAGRVDRLVSTPEAEKHVGLNNVLPGGTGEILNLRDVEQALDNLQRVPTVTADLQITPSAMPGSSDLVLSWKQSKRWRLGLSLDDAGSDVTGRYQVGATLSGDNLLGLSDLAYLSLSKGFGGATAPSPKGTQSVALHYSVPMGYWLYSANASYNNYHQTVQGAFDSYRYSGQSDNIDLGIARVLLRDNRQILTLRTALKRRASRNHIDDTEVLVQRRAVTSVELGVSHRLYAGQSVIQSELSYRQGIKGLGSLQAPEEEFGEGTSLYRLTAAAVTLQTPLRLGEQSLRYVGSVRLQKHHTRLTPQDRFSIGGRYSVRGFDGAASLAAESGMTWRNEWVWMIKDMPYAVPYFGLDFGVVAGPSTADLPGKRLVGAAIGLRGQLSGYLDGLQYEIFYGRPVSKPAELKASNGTWGFSLNQSY